MKDNNKSRERGNTLSLIVTCALFIVVVGLGVDFLLMIFKGHRKLTNTSDAVALELVRNIVRTPKIKLNEGYEMDNWGPLSDNGWIDLYRFNKIVAQVILSVANAAADGSPEVIQIANDMIDHLQGIGDGGGGGGGHGGGSVSLAQRLKIELEKAAHDFSNGGEIDLQLGTGTMLPESIYPAAYAGPGGGGGGGGGGSCCGHVGAPLRSGRTGSCGTHTGIPNTHGRHEDGSGGSGGGGSNGGWCRGKSWSSIFPTPPSPGTTTYQPYADGTPSSEKAALVSTSKFSSFVDRNGPSNIAINPLALPLIISGASVSPSNRIQVTGLVTINGKQYVPGYKELKMQGSLASIHPFAAVPMQPGAQPHLISNKTFEENSSPSFLACVIPPNAYKFIASTIDGQGRQNTVISCAEVASGPTTFDCEFPKGYIEIINIGDRPSYDYNGDAMQTESVYSKELMSGIYLADNGAFTTDPNAINEWALFNAGRGPQPALNDAQGNPRVHGPTNTIHGAKAPSGGARGGGPCMWVNVTHGDPDYYDPECGNKLNQFENAYPPGAATKGDPTSYMAVEQFKQTLRTVFNQCGNYGCPKDSTGLRVYTDGWPNHGDDVNPANPLTKQGTYWRGRPNPVPSGANSKISRPGTVLELLQQVNETVTVSTVEILKNRIYQINPNLKPEEVQNLLESRVLELGQVAYIYRDADGDMHYDTTKPPSMAGDVSKIDDPRRSPAGRLRTISSGFYPTVGFAVNPPKEGDIHLQMYTSFPDPATVGTAEDVVEETPGIGLNNNLLRLRFMNRCARKGKNGAGQALNASGDFCQPD